MSEQFYVIKHIPTGKFLGPDARTTNFARAEKFYHRHQAEPDMATLECVGGWKIVGPCEEGDDRTEAPRYAIPGKELAYYRKQYSTEKLLMLALTMLDSAAEGGCAFLHSNMTLEVIRDRVHTATEKKS